MQVFFSSFEISENADKNEKVTTNSPPKGGIISGPYNEDTCLDFKCLASFVLAGETNYGVITEKTNPLEGVKMETLFDYYIEPAGDNYYIYKEILEVRVNISSESTISNFKREGLNTLDEKLTGKKGYCTMPKEMASSMFEDITNGKSTNKYHEYCRGDLYSDLIPIKI